MTKEDLIERIKGEDLSSDQLGILADCVSVVTWSEDHEAFLKEYAGALVADQLRCVLGNALK